MTEDNQKPTHGTWNRLGNAKGLSFQINQTEQVTFLTDDPEEVPSTLSDSKEGEVYYRFPIKRIDGTDSVIETSAWTLLSELKALAPLKGKTVQISKKSEKGKQVFRVIEVK